MQYKWSQFGFEPLTQLIEWLGWVFFQKLSTLVAESYLRGTDNPAREDECRSMR